MWVDWEPLLEELIHQVFSHHHQQGLLCIPGDYIVTDRVQGIHSEIGSRELWSEGHRYLFGQQPMNPLLDTRDERCYQAAQPTKPSMTGIAWPREFRPGLSWKQNLKCGRSLGRPWRRTFSLPQRRFGKLSTDDDSRKGNRAQSSLC